MISGAMPPGGPIHSNFGSQPDIGKVKNYLGFASAALLRKNEPYTETDFKDFLDTAKTSGLEQALDDSHISKDDKNTLMSYINDPDTIFNSDLSARKDAAALLNLIASTIF